MKSHQATKQFKFLFPRLLFSLLLSVAISACGGGSGGSSGNNDDGGGSGGEPKSLSIAMVGLGDTVYTTDMSPITLEGVAQSDQAIEFIKVENLTNDSVATAAGSSTWSVSIPLAEGDNLLRISVTTADDAQTSIETTITYFPTLSFNTPLTTSDNIAFVGESKEIIFNIGLPNADGKTVTLLNSDAFGQVGDTASAMTDNGQLPDEIQGDGVFSTLVDLNETEEGQRCFRVAVEGGETGFQSENLCIYITDHLGNEELNTASGLASSAKETFEQAIAEGKSLVESAAVVVASMETDPGVGVVKATDEGGVWWVSTDGLLGVYHPFAEGQRGGARGEPAAPDSLLSSPSLQYFPGGDEASVAQATEEPRISQAEGSDGKRIETPRGILVSPYINNPLDGPNFGNTDDYFVPWQTIKNEKSCALFDDTEVLNNGSNNVSVDTFKHFSDFGYIHISSHADNFYNGLLSLWDDVWGPDDFLQGGLSQVVIFTGVVLQRDVENNLILPGTLEADLLAHRVAIASGDSVVILPSFIKHYVKNLPNSLVVLAACRSSYNASMANAFISAGAAAVVGYTDYVSSTYAQNTTNAMLNALYDDKTLGEAVNDAKIAHGANDGDADPAEFTLFGASDLKLAEGVLSNASFEDGVLAPWQKAGDGRVITQLGSTSPTDGSVMSIISTGLGFTTQSGSISQVACLAESATSLKFDWNYYSEEFLEFCESEFQDSFSVRMCEIGDNGQEQNCATLFNRIVDDLCDSVSQSDVAFDQGDVYDTGWVNQSLNIEAYKGKRVKLEFFASDVGDSIYDTAILIDKISVEQ